MSLVHNHFHVHTYYSILDGINSPKKLAETVKQRGGKALAITDHGTLAGIPEFYIACKTAGVKPVLGCEFYMVPDRFNKVITPSPTGRPMRTGYHLILLAKNHTGYKNLIALINSANIEGYYYKPKIDWDILSKHHEGLVATSACIGSEINQHYLAKRPESGDLIIRKFIDMFGQDFYLELMDNHMKQDGQRLTNKFLVKAASKFNLKIIPTDDSHYFKDEDRDLHTLMFRVGKRMEDKADKKKPAGKDKFAQDGYDGIYSFRDTPEILRMFKQYGDVEQWVRNTEDLADKIEEYDIFTKKMKMPNDLSNNHQLLTMMAEGGLSSKGLSGKVEYRQRLDRELNAIGKLGFSSYFMATRQLVEIFRENNCAIGWGRGSAGGSLVSYCLDIIKLDPIKYGLLFERFINEERPDWPDIDIDLPQSRRDEMIEKIVQKFGDQNVAHITTAHSFRPKMLIRDICREYDIPMSKSDRYSALVTVDALSATYEKIQEDCPKLIEELSKDSQGRFILDAFRELIGVHRHMGMHASGIVIAGEPITDYLPVRVEQVNKKDRLVTQYTMDYLPKFGFLKFDILGLKTLDLIYSTGKEVGVDVTAIPDNDAKAFKLIGDGNVAGLFQLDKAKTCRELCKQVVPQTMMNVGTILALHRPGVMDSDQYGIYLRRRKGAEPVKFVIPEMEQFLNPENYGICIFQEDLMRLAQHFAGYTWSEAENLRKGIAKKVDSIVQENLIKLAEKSKALGRREEDIQQVLQQVEAAGRYSFNKAHAIGYAHITYACAYLSANYPLQFFKQVMSLATDDERTFYMSAALERGIRILPPDVNHSGKYVEIEGDSLRFGLILCTGIGEVAANSIIAGRPYTHVDQVKDKVNRSVFSILYAAGALNELKGYGELQLIGIPDEEDVLGISLGGMIAKYGDIVKMSGAKSLANIGLEPEAIVAKLNIVKLHADKYERKMAFVKLIDVHGPVKEAVMFAGAYKERPPVDNTVYVVIVQAMSNGSIQVKGLTTLEEVREAHASKEIPQ